jgi:hypothetical protein
MSPYPIGFEADYVEQRNRLTTFFRLVLAIPLVIVGIAYTIASAVCVVIAWFAVLFTGRYPGSLYEFNAGVLRYTTRVYAYVRLMTDAYPPFDMAEHPEYPVRVPVAPALESYDRVKTGFRLILAIPVMLMSYALGILANVCGILAWVVIVFTGRQSAGLQQNLAMVTAYGARANAYFGLMTEDWPPFGVAENVPAVAV